jgi:hypothetical protein
LAVEVRLTGQSAEVTQTKIVNAPLPLSTGKSDLQVRAVSQTNATLHQYSIDDPRVAEVEGQGYITLPTATTWVYAPADAALQAIDVAPSAGRARAFDSSEAPKTLRVELGAAIAKLCEGKASVQSCFSEGAGR